MSICRLLTAAMGILIAVLQTACTSSTPVPASAGTGQLIALAQDVPVCNAISANVVLQDISFTNLQTGLTEGYMTTTPAFAPEIRLNLEQLRDFTTVLYEYPVKAGSYDQINLNYELGQIAAYNASLIPPIDSLATSFTTQKPSSYISPPLLINAGQTNVMLMDFEAPQMLQTNSSGNLTGKITSVTNISQLLSTSPTGQINPNGFGEIDDLWGFVRSVSNSNTTSNASYIGDFSMQVLSPSTADAPNLPMNLTTTTNKIGFTDLPHLLPDTYVEVDAILDSQGNLAAKTVEAQWLENPFPTQAGVTPSTALIGPIVSITTDAAGNPLQLNLWVHDAEPDDISTLLMDYIYQVDLTVNPTYQASIMGPNFANLTFGPQNLAVGQELVVHGAYTKPSTTVGVNGAPPPFTVQPLAIYLKLQSMQGTLNSMLNIGSDNETGVFILTPCCTLLQGVPLYVVTNNQTAYVNVGGLSGINTVSNILVKGMPYYESNPTTINGVTIPGGSMIFQAKQVHVLSF